MTTDVLDQEVFDLEHATDLRPVTQIALSVTGKRPAASTVWRWVRKGNRGVKLPAIHLCGTWHTTRAAFADWLKRQTAAFMAKLDARDDAELEALL